MVNLYGHLWEQHGLKGKSWNFFEHFIRCFIRIVLLPLEDLEESFVQQG